MRRFLVSSMLSVAMAAMLDTLAGRAGFGWRAGGEVCWLTLPGWEAAFWPSSGGHSSRGS